MGNYNFGAGGLKLGDRVEIMLTGQRGILTREVIHISGCNTFHVVIPSVDDNEGEGGKKVKNIDYLLLRRLEANESLFDKELVLTEENIFAPKGTDVNAQWIKESCNEKEFITEIDEAIGVLDFKIQPGTEVWHKVYGRTMIVAYIYREIYAKELEYGLLYLQNNKEILVSDREYALVPMEQKINLYPEKKESRKNGPLFDDSKTMAKSGVTIQSMERHGG